MAKKITRRNLFKGVSAVSGATFGAGVLSAAPQTQYMADIAIIGSGPAGLALAQQLSRRGVKVTIIESGTADTVTRHGQQRNRVLDSGNGLPYNLSAASIRKVGGTSHIWGGRCPRLVEDDIRCRSRYGYAADWPLEYSELVSFYCQAERFLNVFSPLLSCGPTSINDASVKLAQQLRSMDLKAVMPAGVTLNSQGRYQPNRLAHTTVPDLLSGPNTTLLTGVTARKLNINKQGVCQSVSCTDDAGHDVQVYCKTAIVCGGTIQAARLLMLSDTSAGERGLGNTGGHLGANFMDHPVVRMSARARDGAANNYGYGQAHAWQWYGKYRHQGVGAYLPLIVSDDPRSKSRFFFDIVCEQEPQKVNALTLDSSKVDQFGDALPSMWFERSKFDISTASHARATVRGFIEQSPSLEFVSQAKTWLGCHHLMGTTRMASNDRDGVVDANLKVFGVDNLYVASGSVFPSGAGVNPTLTIVALAIRLADHLLSNAR